MKHWKNNTLLIEIAIAILFFSLSQTIVLQVFAKASLINHETLIQNSARMRAEDVAETLAVSDDMQATLLELGFTATDGGLMQSSGEGYQILADVQRFTQPAGVLVTVNLQGYRGSTWLFAFPVSRYQGVTGT